MNDDDAMNDAAPLLADHRDRVIAFAYGRFEARNPEVVARWGPRERARCSEDLAFHLDALQAALDAGTAASFVSYVRWVATMLEARGVPKRYLEEVLASFRAYSDETFPSGVASAVTGILDAAPVPDVLDEADAEDAAQGALVDVTELAQALLHGRREEAWSLLEGFGEGEHGYIDLAVGAIQPAMYEVGRLWQIHRVSVAQEHLATAQASFLLTKAFMAQRPAALVPCRALFAAVAGNRHHLGVQMVSDAHALRGWEVQELGADVPTADLVSQVVRFRPHRVGLSVSLPQQLATVRDVIGRIRAAFDGEGPTVIVGGRPFNQEADLWARVGADASFADARRAVPDAHGP